jgi:hypothetical protein
LTGIPVQRGYAGAVDTAYLVLLIVAFAVMAGWSLYAVSKLFAADAKSSTQR